MEKKIHLLVISHSFLKKINTEIYSVLKNKYNFKVKLICPQFHTDFKKKYTLTLKKKKLILIFHLRKQYLTT